MMRGIACAPFMVGLVACGASTPAGNSSIVADGIAFESQAVNGGTVEEQRVTLVNEGVTGKVELSLMGDADFSISENTCSDIIESGQECDFLLTFDAQLVGKRTATLTIDSDRDSVVEIEAYGGVNLDLRVTEPGVLWAVKNGQEESICDNAEGGRSKVCDPLLWLEPTLELRAEGANGRIFESWGLGSNVEGCDSAGNCTFSFNDDIDFAGGLIDTYTYHAVFGMGDPT